MLAFITIILSTALSAVVAFRETYDNMKTGVRSFAASVTAGVRLSGAEYLEQTARLESLYRVTLIAADGRVLYDSENDAAEMENHLGRPEIVSAAKDGTGESERFSETLHESSYYYAVKLSDGSFLRVAGTTDSVFATLVSALPLMLALVVLMLLLAVVVARWLMKKILVPLNTLNLEDPLSNDVYEELSPLLGRIARQNEIIAQQLAEMSKKQDEFAAITENMREGLVVVGANAAVLSTNAGALRIFGTTQEAVRGRHIVNLQRGPELSAAVDAALAGEYGRAEFTLSGRQYQAQASPVFDGERVSGAVLLVFDVTELRAAEQLRREFSANVSHELKTPLTSISGYAEIIKDGLVRSEDIPDFASRIYGEAARMIALIDDIMKLSRLDEQSVQIAREDVDLLTLAHSVKKSLEQRAAAKRLRFEVEGEHAAVFGARSVLEELLFNLCENAVKYNQIGRAHV